MLYYSYLNHIIRTSIADFVKCYVGNQRYNCVFLFQIRLPDLTSGCPGIWDLTNGWPDGPDQPGGCPGTQILPENCPSLFSIFQKSSFILQIRPNPLLLIFQKKSTCPFYVLRNIVFSWFVSHNYSYLFISEFLCFLFTGLETILLLGYAHDFCLVVRSFWPMGAYICIDKWRPPPLISCRIL